MAVVGWWVARAGFVWFCWLIACRMTPWLGFGGLILCCGFDVVGGQFRTGWAFCCFGVLEWRNLLFW